MLKKHMCYIIFTYIDEIYNINFKKIKTEKLTFDLSDDTSTLCDLDPFNENIADDKLIENVPFDCSEMSNVDLKESYLLTLANRFSNVFIIY